MKSKKFKKVVKWVKKENDGNDYGISIFIMVITFIFTYLLFSEGGLSDFGGAFLIFVFLLLVYQALPKREVYWEEIK